MSRITNPARPGAIVGTLALALTLTGCGDSGVQPATTEAPAWATGASLVLVAGAHANAPAPTLTSALQAAVGAVADANHTFTLVLNDGSPRIVGGPLSLGNSDCQGDGCDTVRRRAVSHVLASLVKLRATAPEDNLLEAIALAARSSAPGDTVAVCDSGLQTTGALNFTQAGMLTADPTTVSKFLKSTAELPDLTGRTVVFSCLGETAAPQEQAPASMRSALIRLWSSLAKSAGASKVYIDSTPLGTAAATGLPKVTPVPMPEMRPFNPTAAAPTAEVLHQERLAFLPNSATFVDPAAARAVLRPFATWLAESSSHHLHLTGTTSSDGTAAGRTTVSLARADAVKAALISMGAPADRITTDGVGMNWPGYINDRDAHGTLLPAQASSNMSVIVNFGST